MANAATLQNFDELLAEFEEGRANFNAPLCTLHLSQYSAGSVGVAANSLLAESTGNSEVMVEKDVKGPQWLLKTFA
jgi:hypothetical protein